MAHNAELQNRINDGNSGLVGRISSATEGLYLLALITLWVAVL